MSDRNTPGGIDIAAIVFGENDTAVCWVQMPRTEMETRFETISRDEDGPFLVDASGRTLRIGRFDPEAFDQALEQRSFYVHLLDEAGVFVEEYGITPVRPEPATAYGA